MLLRIVSLILFMLLTVGCATDPVVVRPSAVAAPQVQPMTLRPIEWNAYGRADLQRLLSTEQEGTTLLFALTPEQYEVLVANLIEIRRYIQEQSEVISFFRRLNEERSRGQ